MDSRGVAPWPSTVREMADLLLAARGIYPPSFGRQSLGYKLREKASNPLLPILERL